MVLNDCVNVPNSSDVATIGRGERLPSAMALVPSASSSNGLARLLAIRNALAIAPNIASSSVKVSVTI